MHYYRFNLQANFAYRGVMAPVFTPFKNDTNRTVNVDAIPAYADYCKKSGITGILANGTTGEGMAMDKKERLLVAEIWAQLCKQNKQHFMVQVGGASLPDVIDMTRHAEKIGADSILCLPDLFYKPATPADLIRYLQTVAKAAPSTPLLYYHIPRITTVNVHMGTFLNVLGDNVPSFAGIKFSSTILDEALSAVKASNEKYIVFLGSHAIMAGAYVLGIKSSIITTQNILPQLGHTIFENVSGRDISKAQIAQNNLNAVISKIINYGPWVPSTKAAMSILSAVDMGPPRDPFQPLTKVQMKQMEEELKKFSFISI
ncbi:hypothetical protein FQA39_LY09850 [Lamprigera yunnana]|nr:hypothetical protein FQA39_LY09850 [Lamprigera yunnana]